VILIQCIGNRYGGDDGFGPAVFDQLQQMELPENVQVTEHWGEGTELMQHWTAADHVILVDAARSASPPGTLHRFDAIEAPIPADLCIHSTHRFGVAEAVELARALGQLPPRLTLIAVEGRDFAPGDELSEPVAAAIEAVLDAILEETAPA